MEKQIIAAIEKANLQNRDERDNTRFHPSEMGGCHRKIFYSMKGLEGEPFSPRTIRIFDTGNHGHDRFNSYFESLGILIAKEVDVGTEIMGGHVDALLYLEGKVVIVDYKTIGSYGFKLLTEGKPMNENYHAQMIIYIGLLGMTEGYFIFENKDNQELLVKKVKFDKKRYDELMGKARGIKELVKLDKEPEKDYDIKTSWHCSWCRFRFLCFSKEKVKRYGRNEK